MTNAVIGIASIAAFHELLRLVFPQRPLVEYALVTALYALAPLFVAHAVFLNVDYPATALFVLFLYFLLARRCWLAGVSAVCLIFTKETGAAAYAVAMVAFAIVFTPRRQLPVIVLPAAVLLLYLVFARMHLEAQGWVRVYAPIVIVDRTDLWLNTNLADGGMRSFLADIFVLNFQWLYTSVVAAAAFVALGRAEGTYEAGPGALCLRRFFGLLLVGLVYVVTRYRGYNNARYVLLASPVLIVVYYGALLSLVVNRIARVTYLAGCVVLVVASNFWTLDIVSASIFGTFQFGSHRLLDMPSLVGRLKLDSLVYNFEFLQLQYLYADKVRDVRPRPGAILLMGNAIWNFPPEVDGRNYTLGAKSAHALPLFVAVGDVDRRTLESHVVRDGEPFFYAAFANADNDQLVGLRARYDLVATRRYERRGYTLDLYTFRYHLSR